MAIATGRRAVAGHGGGGASSWCQLRATARLWTFAALRVPLILFLRPRVRELSDDRAAVTIPLSRRTRNPAGSMYFGALASGADMVPGMLAVVCGRRLGRPVRFAFRECTARFLRRADGDVTFACGDGAAVASALARSSASRGWHEARVKVVATCGTANGDEPVATFDLLLAVRVR
jgi:acyl-coenzyme A thioesterase PaaI-like protein